MNKRTLIIAFLSMFAVAASIPAARDLLRGESLPLSQAREKWGESEFNLEKFKSGSSEGRASMAVSLIKRKKMFEGKSFNEIRSELGQWDGYYFSDFYPAYLIQSSNKRTREAWQIVFLVNEDYKVKDIFIHKSCCKK